MNIKNSVNSLLVALILICVGNVYGDTLIQAGGKAREVEILRLEGNYIIYKAEDKEEKADIVEVKSFIITPDPELLENNKKLERKVKQQELIIEKAKSEIDFVREELNRVKKENLALRAGKAIADATPMDATAFYNDYFNTDKLNEIKKLYEDYKKAQQIKPVITVGQLVLKPLPGNILRVEGIVNNSTERFAGMVTVEVNIFDGAGNMIDQKNTVIYNLRSQGGVKSFTLDFYGLDNWAGGEANIIDTIWQ